MAKPPDNDLKKIAEQINSEFLHVIYCAEKVIQHAVKCGEHLSDAKQKVDHGSWATWLNANTRLSERQAQKYMRLYKKRLQLAKAPQGADLTINQALKLLAKPQPKTQSQQITGEITGDVEGSSSRRIETVALNGKHNQSVNELTNSTSCAIIGDMQSNYEISVEKITKELTQIESDIQRLPPDRYKRILPVIVDILIQLAREKHFQLVKHAIIRLRKTAYANEGRKKYRE